MTKQNCRKCGTEKPLSEFWRNKAYPNGHFNVCKACAKPIYAEYGRRHRAGTPNYVTENRHGMTKGEFARILASQGGVCAACQNPSKHTLHVDHDHACCDSSKKSCGKCTRGLLCTRCNLVAGFIENPNYDHVRDYLARYAGARLDQ